MSAEPQKPAGSVSLRSRPARARRAVRAVAAAAAAHLLMVGCTPFDIITAIGPDAAYTATEDRRADDVWDDNVLKLSLNKAFLDDSTSLFGDVGTVVYEGRVLLVGTVADPAARKRAGDIARRQAGVRAVINRIQVADSGGFDGYVSDIALEKRIQAELLFDDDIASSNLRVRAVRGIVYLFGAASSAGEIARVLDAVRDFKEVRRIDNLLWVRKKRADETTASKRADLRHADRQRPLPAAA